MSDLPFGTLFTVASSLASVAFSAGAVVMAIKNVAGESRAQAALLSSQISALAQRWEDGHQAKTAALAELRQSQSDHAEALAKHSTQIAILETRLRTPRP